MLAGGTTAVCATAVVLTAAPPPPLMPGRDLPTRLTAVAALPFDSDLADLAGAAAATSPIGAGIENAYLALEPFVQYGAELLRWAVGWVPFVGLLAPQITFFYDFGESITRSLLFNTIELLDGTSSFGAALSMIGSDVGAAFSTLVQTQQAWIQGLLPPLPPFPTFPTAAALDGDLTPDLAAGTAALGDSMMTSYAALMPWGELAVNVLAFGAASFISTELAVQLIDNPFDLIFAHPYPTGGDLVDNPYPTLADLDPVQRAVFDAGYRLNDELLFPTNNPPHADGPMGILPSLLQNAGNVLSGTSLTDAWDDVTQNLTEASHTWLPFSGTGQPVEAVEPGLGLLDADVLGLIP